jgi:hypothetical protein
MKRSRSEISITSPNYMHLDGRHSSCIMQGTGPKVGQQKESVFERQKRPFVLPLKQAFPHPDGKGKNNWNA